MMENEDDRRQIGLHLPLMILSVKILIQNTISQFNMVIIILFSSFFSLSTRIGRPTVIAIQ